MTMLKIDSDDAAPTHVTITGLAKPGEATKPAETS
jgi:hypothetical protein